MKRIKKMINIFLLLAMVVAMLPLSKASAAANAPLYFVPNNGPLTQTANMDLTVPAALDRNSAYLTNSGTLSFTGTFQQVDASSINATVDQITLNGTWQPVSGKTQNIKAVAKNSTFTLNGLQLFPGYNRITITGAQGAVSKKDVFYVLFDSVALLNSLTVTSNGKTYPLNEGFGIVASGNNTVLLQGVVSNATGVTVKGQTASMDGNGNFNAQAINLTAGKNTIDIVITGGSENLTLYRDIYFFDPSNIFSVAKVTVNSEEASLLGETPTLTSMPDASNAGLTLRFMVPDTGDTFKNMNNSSIDVSVKNGTVNNGTVVQNIPVADVTSSVAKESVINSTYGSQKYNLVEVKLTSVIMDKTGLGNVHVQDLEVKLNYAINDPIFSQTYTGVFRFTYAPGQKIINKISLLPNMTSAADVDSSTPIVMLDGESVTSKDFYVLVDSSATLSTSDLKVSIRNSNGATVIAAAQDKYYVSGSPSTPNTKKQVFLIKDLPAGTQTLDFSVNAAPISASAVVTYASKNYIAIDSFYDGQTFDLPAQTVSLSGKVIGFQNRILSQQLLINDLDVTGKFQIDASDYITPADITPNLIYGENTIRLKLVFKDSEGNALRSYEKVMKIYVINKNAPNIPNMRPLTPSTGRVSLDQSPSQIITLSPEFQNQGTYYSSSQSKVDLYIEGTGATKVDIKDGQTLIFSIKLPTVITGTTPSLEPAVRSQDVNYSQADFYGNDKSFRVRLNNVGIDAIGTHTLTVVLTNNSGGSATQTMEIHHENQPFRILSPKANTGDQIIVNKNFVLFDVEAIDATDVQINGKSATERTDIDNRFTYTLTGLKGDSDNKVKIVVKRSGGDVTTNVTVKYVTDTNLGSMFMEMMGTKHSVFNKEIQLSFPKNTVLRRVDGKLQPQVNLLFGIADPGNGNTEPVNDYGQILNGINQDSRTYQGELTIPLDSNLTQQFTFPFGRQQFSRISEFYWISAGLGEQDNVGDSNYKPATGGLTPFSVEGTFKAQSTYKDSRIVKPSERGTLTLRFNGNVVDQAASETTVFFLGNNDIQWRNIGGIVDVKNNTITVPFDEFGYYMVGKINFSYGDITNHLWARNLMQATFAKGFMPAKWSNTFGAEDYVTRGEFAALLVRSLGIPLVYDSNNTFVDVDPTSRFVTWNYAEIETAARAGIVEGQENRRFNADGTLSRQDAAVMMARALNLKLAAIDDKLINKLAKAFEDSGSMNRYALPAIDAINSNGIMVGSSSNTTVTKGKQPLIFNSTGQLTRAEEAQIAVRLLQKYTKSLPANLS